MLFLMGNICGVKGGGGMINFSCHGFCGGLFWLPINIPIGGGGIL